MTNTIYTTDFFKDLINQSQPERERSTLVKIDNTIKRKEAKQSQNLLDVLFSSQA